MSNECIELSLEDDQYLALLKLNGTRILNKELTIVLKGHGRLEIIYLL